MEAIFESSNQLVRDEVGYWNAQMIDLTQKSIAEGEKFAAAVQENMTRTFNQQAEFLFSVFKHNAALVERQVKMANDAIAQAVPAKG